jgi:hypothetical protein
MKELIEKVNGWGDGLEEKGLKSQLVQDEDNEML